ncbi:MAG: glycoside hydrolase family 172 protein [Rhodothermales bacterium]
MRTSTLTLVFISIAVLTGCTTSPDSGSEASWQVGQEGVLYKAPAEGVHTRWASPENPNGEKGAGGQTNQGAKGQAFYIIPPGEDQVLLDREGAGVITRMWMSGTIGRNAEQRRMVRLDMYWDGAEKPAVSAPIGDFFGVGLGLTAPFDSKLFSNPEGRSFNFTIPMPYRTSARVVVTNESPYYVLFWYDLNFVEVPNHADDVMYFHAYWNRDVDTGVGIDYEILPRVEGTGRFIGTNVGVIGDPAYRGTWFGEGEVKMYVDGDTTLPTLVGTGTEDYIGSGWGQGEYDGDLHGSTVADYESDLYTFYRYHIADPVYFHEDLRVTIQQMGAATAERVREMAEEGAELQLAALLDLHGASDITRIESPAPEHVDLLDMDPVPSMDELDLADKGGFFYRSDDVSATAYFYLDRPSSNLPDLPDVDLRVQDMQEKVWDRVD